jgi:hypothetical protein
MTSRTSIVLLLILVAGLAPRGAAQANVAQQAAPKPFVADAKLGESYLIGRTEKTASGNFVNTMEHLLVSIESAQLALRFPARDKLIVAGENQQLLVLSGTMKNPQQQKLDVYGGSMMTIRFFDAEAGRALYGQETTVRGDSLTFLTVKLAPGESAPYVMVLRIPSNAPSLKLATLRPYGPLRRYDLGPVVTSATSVFARTGASIASSANVAVGQPFDFDSFDMKVSSVRDVPKIGSYSATSGKHLFAVELQVTNRMLMPERWGWQYCTPELKDASGNAIQWNRDMLDAQSGQTFSRDLNPGESATVVYVFSSDSRVTPASLTLSMLKTKRQVQVALR